MRDINQYVCTGRLGADPETRTFPSGDPVVNLRVAVSNAWKDSDTGEKREKTLWLSVKITNKPLCSVAEQYLKKGSRVAISGQLETRSYDKDGQTHHVTELVLGPFNSALTMLDGRPEGEPAKPATKPQTGSAAPAFDDDEIPFSPEWRI